MNERIQQLAEQIYGTQATEQEIKFAELIVKECVEKCVYVVDRQEILAHFGVEE